MQRTHWSYGRARPDPGKALLARILLAALAGLTPEQFAEEEIVRMQADHDPPDCKLCKYRVDASGQGWCYMFRERPEGWCAQFREEDQ